MHEAEDILADVVFIITALQDETYFGSNVFLLEIKGHASHF